MIHLLDKPEHWLDWFNSIKELSINNGIWEYIDPEGQQNLPTEPVQPDIKEYPKHTPGPATIINQLGDDDKEDYNWRLQLWQIEHSQWEKKREYIAKINSRIIQTVHSKHSGVIFGKTTPRNKLIALKLAFKLTPRKLDYQSQTRTMYQLLQTLPRGNSQHEQLQLLDAWLEQWLNVVERAKEIGLPETEGLLPQQAFLQIATELVPEYANSRLEKLRNSPSAAKSIDAYVSDVMNLLRMHTTNRAATASPPAMGAATSSGNANQETSSSLEFSILD